MEAIRVHVRYDSLNEESKITRRERHKRMDIFTPKFELPECGKYLWNWFSELNNSISRYNDFYTLLPTFDILNWCKLTKNFMTPIEYDIIKSMDVMFCYESNLELNAQRSKREDEQQRKLGKK